MIDLVIFVLIGYYALAGYRKPHGNILKYIILVFAGPGFITIYQMVKLDCPWMALIEALIIGVCCYVAGRLHSLKQNIFLMSIVTILRLIINIGDLLKGNVAIGFVSLTVIWIDIFVAYVLRYKEHKEAGLMDAPKE